MMARGAVRGLRRGRASSNRLRYQFFLRAVHTRPFLQIGAAVEALEQGGGPAYGTLGYVFVGYYFIFMAALGAAQAGGVATVMIDLVRREPHWVRSDLALIDTPALRVSPRFNGNGFELRGTF